eukprot:10079723-Lingulodinium_polyedra.AAC.1
MECLRTPHAPVGPTRISGDNIGIVRYAAGTARLSDPSLHGVLDSPLGILACSSRRVTWMAVRR